MIILIISGALPFARNLMFIPRLLLFMPLSPLTLIFQF
jgi:hypothetical protein